MGEASTELAAGRGVLDLPGPPTVAPALGEQLRVVIEHLSEGLVLSDLSGQLLHWNPAALAMHGFHDAAEWRRRLSDFTNIFEMADLEGRVLTFEEWPMPRLFRGEAVRDMEVRIRRLDVEWERVFLYGGSVVEDATGKPLAFLTITDITSRRQGEEEIRQLNADLEQRVRERTAELARANEELEAFSYSVSHDLRAPLRTIEGFSQVILEDYSDLLPEAGRGNLRMISQGARRMDALIEDVLRFSRLSRQPMESREVDTGRQVRAAIDELRTATTGREMEWTIGELPACWGDPALLKQVWLNLLSNAVKYTRKRPVAKIEVTAEAGENGERVYVVRDNGAGFDMRHAGKLFGVFRRLHRADEYEGTGAGLAIVQRIVRRHGGRVWAAAEVDRGATFSFTLPSGAPVAAF